LRAREQATILILSALVIASGLVILAQRNRLIDFMQVYENLELEHAYTSAQYELLYSSYQDLEDQASEYRKQIIQLNHDMDKVERYETTWRKYRDKYMEALLENARLQGLLLEREYGDNMTRPLVEPRKDQFRIGDVIAFQVDSEIALYGSYFTIYDPNGTLVWEGDPLAEWVEKEDRWFPPYYGQTAYMEPMVLRENYTLGNWTWTYRFGEVIEVEGWFTVIEAYEDVISTGPEGDIWGHVIESITDDANIAQEAIESPNPPSFLYNERLDPSDGARDRTNYSLIWLIFTCVTIGIFIILRGR